MVSSALRQPRQDPAADLIGVQAGFYTLLVWLFLYLSRILDVTIPNLKITMILNVIWLGAALFSGGLMLVFKSRVAILFLVFLGWMGVCLPFSVWRSGSMETLMLALRSVLLMASIIALVRTTRHCIQLMHTIGYALALAGLVSILTGEQSVTGRLALVAGSFSDPNYYCMMLLAGLPFLLLKATLANGKLKQVIPLLATMPVLLTAAKTGSRAGFIAMCTMFAIYFVRSSPARKLYLAVSGAAAIMMVTLLASDTVLNRYTTIFSLQAEGPTTREEAAAFYSARARSHLFWRSIELTIENPIVGVGPGMFAVAEAADAKEEGNRAAWHETHNTYTQVSSEVGLPGALFYISALAFALSSVTRLSRLKNSNVPAWESIRLTALHLQMSMISVAVGAAFLSIAYTGLVFILSALAIVLERSAAADHPWSVKAQRLRAAVPAPAIGRMFGSQPQRGTRLRAAQRPTRV